MNAVERCAYLPVRDEVDKYLIDELTSLGGKGTIIQDERKTEQFPLERPGTITQHRNFRTRTMMGCRMLLKMHD